MPDANRARSASSRPAAEPPLDPRAALAQQYLQKAQAELAEEEAAAPRSARRGQQTDGASSIDKSTFAHLVLVACAITFAEFVILLSLFLMMQNAAAGGMMGTVLYTIAIPVGVVVFAALSYASVCYLSIIESTSSGRMTIEGALYGGWREWFWTLPSTLGMLAAAGFLGWLVSLVLPINVWAVIGGSLVLLYPVLQLSTLETGSPLAPISPAVIKSLAQRPIHWIVFYGLSAAIAVGIWGAWRLAWRDPPIITLLVMGPVFSLALFIYAWLLGMLAKSISAGSKP